MADLEYLSVDEALARVLASVSVLNSEKVVLGDCLGRVLAEDVFASENLPPFDNSAMDGYAVRAADVANSTSETPTNLQVIADIAAGYTPTVTVTAGTAARIMTGAPLPDGADSIIPVENTNEPWRSAERPLPETIDIFRPSKKGDHVRPIGDDITVGQKIISTGHILRPQEIGLLASLGITQVVVIRQPRIGILSTGDELLEIDQPLEPGKIRNSNSQTLIAQVKAIGAQPVPLGIAKDTEADVRLRLDAGLQQKVDLFVSSAGVSVGAYDVVTNVLEKDGDVTFWRVRMRPGKPLAFGTYASIPYLGLPGNPVSATLSFDRFGRQAILKMAGRTRLDWPQISATLTCDLTSDGRQTYVRGLVTKVAGQYQAALAGGQGSHMIHGMVNANALLIIPDGVKQIKAGTPVQALMIDWSTETF